MQVGRAHKWDNMGPKIENRAPSLDFGQWHVRGELGFGSDDLGPFGRE